MERIGQKRAARCGGKARARRRNRHRKRAHSQKGAEWGIPNSALCHSTWLAGEARPLLRQGAHADLDQALEASRQAESSWYSSYPLIFLARLSLFEGALNRAITVAQEALTQCDERGDLQWVRWAAGVIAEIEIREGHTEAARALLVPLLDRSGLEECDVTTLLPVLAWAPFELGQIDLAADTVEQALTRAQAEEMRLVMVEALRVRVLVALRRGHHEEAARSLASDRLSFPSNLLPT